MDSQNLPSQRQSLHIKPIKFCPACDNTEFENIFDFGKVPLAGYFPLPGNSDEKFLIPMELRSCKTCELVQINPDVNDELLFEDYRYISSIGMQTHFDAFAKWFHQSNLAKLDSSILEIGCNDGPLLEALNRFGYKPIGIDPATNIVRRAVDKGLEVFCNFFNSDFITSKNLERYFDVIISCNSFAHISNIDEIAKGVALALKQRGLFIVEVQSLSKLVENRAYDFVYHEHKYYYSIFSISNLLSRHGLHLIDGMEIDTHGGSMRLVFSKIKGKKSENLEKLIYREESLDLSPSAISHSVNAFMSELGKLKEFLKIASANKELCVGLGASGRANMLINYLLPEALAIDEIYDESKERIGREMALSGIPIRQLDSESDLASPYVIVFAWNFAEILIKKWKNKKSIFILPLPKFSVRSINKS